MVIPQGTKHVGVFNVLMQHGCANK